MAESSLLRVLLVEDLPSQRQLGRWALEAAGLEVVTAADGLTGLELAWSARPDVILLDLVLPGISGLELLRRYRQDRGTTPVLVLTGAGDPRVANLALARGAILYCSSRWLGRRSSGRSAFLPAVSPWPAGTFWSRWAPRSNGRVSIRRPGAPGCWGRDRGCF